MNGRERILATIRHDSIDRAANIPISMMAASDLIGTTYRTYATDYRVQVRGQIAFSEKFEIDHVSAISDPAVEASDCGAEVVYHDNQPPALDEAKSLLREKTTLLALVAPAPAMGRRMTNRLRVVEELRAQAGSEKLIEGWVEGPVAEASDLRGINRVMMDFYDDPEFVRDLFAFIYDMEMEFARAQIQAGADIIGVGDAAASLIGPVLYEEFVLEYHAKYIDSIHEMGGMVRLHICGDSRHVLPWLQRLRPDVMDLDYQAPVSEARAGGGPEQILTGNIDPVRVLKNGTPDSIRAALSECYRQADSRNYMVAAGCEIPRDTPEENIMAMTEFARATV